MTFIYEKNAFSSISKNEESHFEFIFSGYGFSMDFQFFKVIKNKKVEERKSIKSYLISRSLKHEVREKERKREIGRERECRFNKEFKENLVLIYV